MDEERDEQALAVGDRVEANYKNEGNWYPATIEDIQGQDYLLSWYDGDKSDRSKRADQIRPLKEAEDMKDALLLKEGVYVKARRNPAARESQDDEDEPEE